MPYTFNGKLVLGISSRALFNLDDSHSVYEKEGILAYQDYQIAHENEVLKPGVAFHLVKKLLALNEKVKEVHPHNHEPQVEVILLSRNSADTGLRVFNSIEHYNLNVTRAAFTGGQSPYRYVSAFGAHLFLSAHPEDVRHALQAGCAAATIASEVLLSANESEELRIAFDGDAVLFSDESEKVYQQLGLQAFSKNEKEQAQIPLSGGPFRGFLAALHTLQTYFPPDNCPIRTALVTARSAPAHERVIRTLRAWKIRIDEMLFLGGLTKVEFLKAFQADLFFDDQRLHCEIAQKHIATGHVPFGIINE